MANTTHFIGIGGIGMSAIAQVMIHLGYAVSGSDLRANEETRKLANLGARIQTGHVAGNLGADVGTVVYSSAVAANNPEILEAKRRGLLLLGRGEMLAELMRKKRSIVVSGSHGKTTTTAMVTTMLLDAGFDPTSIIGGRLKAIAGNARAGTDEWFVAESDESDGSFLRLLPTVAVVTNVDHEHLSHYGSYANLEKSFVEFCAKVPFDGRVILCADDHGARSVANLLDRKPMTYGQGESAELRIANVRLTAAGAEFDLGHEGRSMGTVRLRVTGLHNVYNATAAAGVGLQVGLTVEQIARGLGAYEGIGRRLESKGTSAGGVKVFDDYAHHPSEIRASVSALKVLAEGKDVHVLFQPHRYSRLGDLWGEFTLCFGDVATVGVVPVYAASEAPLAGIDSERFAADLARNRAGRTAAFPSIAAGVAALRRAASAGDVFVAMGAGDITTATDLFLEGA